MTCLYLVLDNGVPGFPQGTSDPVVLENKFTPVKILFVYRTITYFGWPFHAIQLKIFNLVPSLAELNELTSQLHPDQRLLA